MQTTTYTNEGEQMADYLTGKGWVMDGAGHRKSALWIDPKTGDREPFTVAANIQMVRDVTGK